MTFEQEFLDLAIALDAVEISAEAAFDFVGDISTTQKQADILRHVKRASVMAGIVVDYIAKAQELLQKLEPACFVEPAALQVDLNASVIVCNPANSMACQGKKVSR